MTSVRANFSLRGSLTFTASGDFCYSDHVHSDTLDGSGHAAFTVEVGSQKVEVYAGSFDNSGVDTEWRVWLDATGNDQKVAQAPTLGWYQFAVVRVSGVLSVLYKADSSSSWTTIAAGTHTSTTVTIYWFSWTDGATDAANTESKRAPKLWTASRDTTQLTSEARKSTVVDATNLYGFWPLEVYTNLADAGGGSHNFTIVGTGTTFAGQPSFPDDTGSHSLGATGLESATNIGSGALAQKHAFSGTGLVSVTHVGSGALAQHHAFGSQTGLVSSTEIGTGPLGGTTHDLGATGLVSLTTIGSGPLAQHHALGGTGLVSITHVGSGALAQHHAFGSQTGLQSVTNVGSGNIAQHHSFGSQTGLVSTTTIGSGPLAVKHALGAGSGLVSATRIGEPSGQSTSVNANGKSSTSGYRIKRGNPSDTSAFFTGPSTFMVRGMVEDWSSGPDIADLQNVIAVNYDGGGGGSHYGQLYNIVDGPDAGKFVLYKGEGVPEFDDDPIVRDGAYAGWFIAGFRCLGDLDDKLEFFFLADDQAPEDLFKVVMDNAGGLRQVYVYGQQLLPTVDEQCNQLHACTAIVSNRYWSDAEIIAQRDVDHPSITGSHIFAFWPLDNVEDGHEDKSHLYGGAGGHDAEAGMLELGITANESPYTSGTPPLRQNHVLGATGLVSATQVGSGNLAQHHSFGGQTGLVSTTQIGSGALGSTVHELGGVGLTSQTHVGSGNLTQLHAFGGQTGLVSATQLGSGNVAQNHSLGGTGLVSQTQVGSGNLTQLHAFGGTGLVSLTQVGSGPLSQRHSLGGVGLESATQIGSGPLAQKHAFGGTGLVSETSIGSGPLGSEVVYELGAVGLVSQTHVGSGAIAQHHSFGAQTGLSSTTHVGSATLGQKHDLGGVGLVSLTEVGSGALGLGSHSLGAVGLESATNIGSGPLAQHHAFGGQTGLASATQVGSGSLAQKHALGGTGLVSSTEVGSAALGLGSHILGALGLESATSVGSAPLAQHHFLGGVGLESETQIGEEEIPPFIPAPLERRFVFGPGGDSEQVILGG